MKAPYQLWFVAWWLGTGALAYLWLLVTSPFVGLVVGAVGLLTLLAGLLAIRLTQIVGNVPPAE